MKGRPKVQATGRALEEAATVAILKFSPRGLLICDPEGRELDYSMIADALFTFAMPAAMKAELCAFCALASIPPAELLRRLIAHYLRAEPLPPIRERDLEALLKERIEALKRSRK